MKKAPLLKKFHIQKNNIIKMIFIFTLILPSSQQLWGASNNAESDAEYALDDELENEIPFASLRR